MAGPRCSGRLMANNPLRAAVWCGAIEGALALGFIFWLARCAG